MQKKPRGGTTLPRSPKKAESPETPVLGSPNSSVPCEEIACLAYSYWEARGRQGGSAEEDWLRAEQELRNRQDAAAKKRVVRKKAAASAGGS